MLAVMEQASSLVLIKKEAKFAHKRADTRTRAHTMLTHYAAELASYIGLHGAKTVCMCVYVRVCACACLKARVSLAY